MSKKTLLALWGGLFILCAGLGFIPGFSRNVSAGAQAALTVLSVAFFAPPAYLLYAAKKEKDAHTLKLVRGISLLSLGLTLLALVLNVLSAMGTVTMGNALFGVLTVFGTGNATQVNTIVAAVDTALLEYGVVGSGFLSTLNLIAGIIVAMLVAMVLLGGIKRIGSVSEKLVPFMALFYIVLSVGVVVLNFSRLPYVLESIVAGAFNPAAFTGGTIGSLFISMQKGVSRGIFSNEAGLGTGSIAHACADTKKPVKQGMFGIFEVFADTIVICTLTALVILCSGTSVNYGQAAGAELTISGFTTTYGGWASIFTAVALCCFAFSTIIGWGLYGSRFLVFLCKSNKVARPFFVVYALVAILGATMDLGLLWSIADTFNGLMSIPNLIALLLLSGTVVQMTRAFFESEG